jgi:hypothetical protein
MRRLTRLATVLVALSIASCGTPDPFPTDNRIPDDLNVRLSRTQCYGTCPAYTVTVKADGAVSFVGQKFTKTEGQAEGQIDQVKLRQLIQEFKNANFFALEDSYTERSVGDCSTDGPTFTTALTINGTSKEVQHYTGCEAPDELDALEDKIDEIVGTERWVGRPG